MKILTLLLVLSSGLVALAQPFGDSCSGSPNLCSYFPHACDQTCTAEVTTTGGFVYCYSGNYVAYCNEYDQFGNLVSRTQAGGTYCHGCCSL